MKEGVFSLSIRTKHFFGGDNGQASVGAAAPLMPMPAAAPVYAPPAPVAAAAPPSSAPSKKEAAPADDESNYLAVKSPMVGTFYRSSSPDKAVYVKIGDMIGRGSRY